MDFHGSVGYRQFFGHFLAGQAVDDVHRDFALAGREVHRRVVRPVHAFEVPDHQFERVVHGQGIAV